MMGKKLKPEKHKSHYNLIVDYKLSLLWEHNIWLNYDTKDDATTINKRILPIDNTTKKVWMDKQIIYPYMSS